MKRLHLIITGKVQGVFFRDSCQKKAQELDVKGWVKNTSGGVEAVLEGEDERVNQLVEWCKKGPNAAEVEKVDFKEEDFQDEFEEFKILY